MIDNKPADLETPPPSTARAQPRRKAASRPTADLAPPDKADELSFEAERKITLRCGKSSITLYPNGKIVLRGEYILSDAQGVNRLAGGQIELN